MGLCTLPLARQDARGPGYVRLKLKAVAGCVFPVTTFRSATSLRLTFIPRLLGTTNRTSVFVGGDPGGEASGAGEQGTSAGAAKAGLPGLRAPHRLPVPARLRPPRPTSRSRSHPSPAAPRVPPSPSSSVLGTRFRDRPRPVHDVTGHAPVGSGANHWLVQPESRCWHFQPEDHRGRVDSDRHILLIKTTMKDKDVEAGRSLSLSPLSASPPSLPPLFSPFPSFPPSRSLFYFSLWPQVSPVPTFLKASSSGPLPPVQTVNLRQWLSCAGRDRTLHGGGGWNDTTLTKPS